MLVQGGIHGACVAADDESGCGEDASNGPPSLRGWSLTHCSFLPPARPYVGHACSLSCPITVPLLSTELGESPTTPSLSSVRWSVVADCLLACLSWLCGIREESKACYLVAYLSPPPAGLHWDGRMWIYHGAIGHFSVLVYLPIQF